MTVEERFWSKVERTDDCWLWTASLVGGYGRIKVDGRGEYAHRLSWEMSHGPVPDGLCVLHHCDVRRCVKPGHLFLGTRLDNNKDRDQKGRQWNARKVACIAGHPLTGANLYRRSDGRRLCIACGRARKQRSRVAA
jgi:hypothetical protein